MSTPLDRAKIAGLLNRGNSVELGWSLVLHPPSAPGAPGANGSYRWVFYEPPLREDGTRGKRVGLCPGKETCNGQDRRRWRHSAHDWRHAAAVWQLFELRLDPEDVAEHLGHGDGYTLYQLYVGSRPGRERRAAKVAAELGDPRA